MKYGHQVFIFGAIYMTMITIILKVVIANMLSSYRNTVTLVTRAHEEGSDEGMADSEGPAACQEWRALKLQLSRDDMARGTEIETYIVKDLIVRHQQHIERHHT